MNQDQGCRTYNDERPKSPIEKRQSNLNSFLQFREKKEKPEILFTSFWRKKRNLKTKIFSTFERRKREMDIIFSGFKKRKRK